MNLRRVAFQACWLSLLACSPSLYLYSQYDVAAITSFCDGDEPCYLYEAVLAAEQRGASAVYKEHDQQKKYSELLAVRPNFLTAQAVGYLSKSLGGSPVRINLVLDLICFALSYIILVSFFRRFTDNQAQAEFAAIVALCLPTAAYLPNYFEFDTQFGNFAYPGTLMHACVSALRSPYTQIGFLIFVFAATQTLNAIEHCGAETKRPALRSVIFCCSATGLLSLVYPFAWLSALTLCPVLLFSAAILSNRQGNSRKKYLTAGMQIAAGSVALSLPIILAGKASMDNFTARNLTAPADYWFFSPISALLCVCAAVISYASPSQKVYLWRASVVALLLTELITMNLNHFIPALFTSIHFPVFFIYPLLSGLFAVPLSRIAGRLKGSAAALRLMSVVLTSLFAWTAFMQAAGRIDRESIELERFMNGKFRGSVFAFNPYSMPLESRPEVWNLSNFPISLAAHQGLHVLYQDWLSILPPDEAVKRERAEHLILNGTDGLIGTCSYDSAEGNPGLTYSQWSALISARRKSCAIAAADSENKCALLKRFAVDWVLWDAKSSGSPPQFLLETSRLAWESSGRRYSIHAVDLNAVLGKLSCN